MLSKFDETDQLAETIKIFSKGCLLGNLLGGNIIYTVLVRGKQQAGRRQAYEVLPEKFETRHDTGCLGIRWEVR